jgi:cysteinyl-tRNA synthetase
MPARTTDRGLTTLQTTLRRAALFTVLNIAAWTAWAWRDVPVHVYETVTNQRPLQSAKSWYYHLANLDLDKVAAVDADLFIIDHARPDGFGPLDRADVERLKNGPNGKRRYVVAYMSIGEAEMWRWYWREEWKDNPKTRPSWLKAENCAWPGGWAVRYWEDGWRDIIYRAEDAFVKRIARAGFDGVYLDRVDMYGVMRQERADTEELMIDLVQSLAAAGRAINPRFLVIPQNGEELLLERGYRRTIDALGKEDLLYGHSGTAVRNTEEDIAWSLARIRALSTDWKPTFVVEYLLDAQHIAKTKAELRTLGLVPTVQPRGLDGSDPTKQLTLEKSIGTAEYIKQNCDKSNSW